MDITYKPYIRDNEFEVDYSIPFPRITSSYKPKYIVDEDQQREPEETSVKSDIDLTNSPESNIPSGESKSSSRKQSRSFSSKEEFSTTMLPIYERLLKQKGLNPAFAKALVAQDGLESAWGKSPSGTFNFGGIKGKGTVKSTREVLNGKDIRIDQEFKDFSSLEDYANYKINLLNNKRYNAFSGSVNDFASRVAKGGYATDPEYLKALQRVIKSVKLGGILNKFQSGGKVKDRWTDRESIEKTQQWMSDWYSKRKPIINNNLWDDHYLPKWLQHDEEGFNWLNDRLTSVETFLYNSGPEEQEAYKKAVNGPIRELFNIDISDKSMEGKEGYFNPTHHYLVVRADSKLPVDQIAAHELAHSTDPYFIIDTIDEYRKRRPILEINAIPDEYLDNSAEIYARLMQYRKAHNIDPNYKFTKQDIENLRNNQTERIRYGFKFKNKNTREIQTQILDRLGDIDQPKPYVDWDIEDVREFRKYKLEGDPDLFNRYNDDFLLFLLNDIAQNINTDNKIQKSKLGGIVPKYQKPSGPLQSLKNSSINLPKYNLPFSHETTQKWQETTQKWDDNAIKAYIKEFEGYSEKIYDDGFGNLTIGYGHKLTPEEKIKWKNKKFTKKELEDLFEKDYQLAKESVNKYYRHLQLKDNEYAALISTRYHGGERLIRARRDSKGRPLPNTVTLVFSPKLEEAIIQLSLNRTDKNLENVINEMQYINDSAGLARRYGTTRALMEGKIHPENLGTLNIDNSPWTYYKSDKVK